MTKVRLLYSQKSFASATYLASDGSCDRLGFRRGRGGPAAGSMSKERARKSSCTEEV